jgi:hypothetical protein
MGGSQSQSERVGKEKRRKKNKRKLKYQKNTPL